jgi:hypothetical protein
MGCCAGAGVLAGEFGYGLAGYVQSIIASNKEEKENARGI